MSQFPATLRRLRNAAGYTQEELARLIGMQKSTVSMYEQGNREPDYETLEAIADVLNVPIGSLISSADKSSVTNIPVLGRVAAGIPIAAIQEVVDYEEITLDMARHGEHFGLMIRGDSMEPRIVDGDVVIVRKQHYVDSGDIAIVLVNGEDATCKRVVHHDNGISLNAFNPAAYAPHFYTKQEIETLPVEIIGKVVELRGKF